MTEAVENVSGRCLCGAVSFAAEIANRHVGVCHCSMCRRWSGGVVFALEGARSVTFSGDENLGVFASSDWGERCFCKVCGSNLVWRSPMFGHIVVMAGALDDNSGLEFTSQIYVDHKPAFYDFANKTTMETEAEFVAKFAPPDSHNFENDNG